MNSQRVNMKSKRLLIILAIIFGLMATSILMFGAQAMSAQAQAGQASNAYFIEKNAYLDAEIPQAPVGYNQSFSVVFSIQGDMTAQSVTYETSGFKVNSVINNFITISVSLSYISISDEAVFTLFAEVQNDHALKANIYGLSTPNGVFVSNLSQDSAWEAQYAYQLSEGQINEAEYTSFVQQFRNQCVEESNNKTSLDGGGFTTFATGTNFAGTILWRDNGNNNYPLQEHFVEIYMTGTSDTLIGSGYTNQSGYFNIERTTGSQSSFNIYLIVYPRGLRTRVDTNAGGNYSLRHPTTGTIAATANATTTFTDFTIQMNNDTGRAFQISQSIIFGALYVQAMGSTPTFCELRYPAAGTSYSPSLNRVNIIDWDFWDWDVILHEYGHFTMANFNIVAANSGGSHAASTQSQIDFYVTATDAKQRGINFVWSEGWADFMGIQVTLYWGNLNRLLNVNGGATLQDANDSWYQDRPDNSNGYTQTPAVSYNLGDTTQATGAGSGEGHKRSVARALYALYIQYPAGSRHQTMWNIAVVNNKPTTFSRFVNFVYASGTISNADFGVILSRYGMSSRGISHGGLVSGNAPTFSYTTAGGGSTNHGNNSFQLVFTNASGTEILRTARFTTTSHQITTQQWNDILAASGTTFGVQLLSFSTNTPETGGYFSVRETYTKPVSYTFTTANNGATITGITGTAPANLVIPKAINGVNITNVGNGSASILVGQNGVTNVVFEEPSNVTTIAANAFSGATGMSQISIPASVTNIASNAFENCTSLTSVTLSNNLTSIGSSSFKRCTSLTNITIPNSVTNIGSDAFRSCSNLTNITIPPNVTSIADNTFKDCTGLISVSIPNNVTSIGSSVFENCNNLTNIALPSSLTTIGSKAFQNCKSIINLTISSSVTSIGSNAFLNCHKLNNITIPQGINAINDSTFANCYEFTNITIPSSVTSIGYNAFGGCVGLTNIFIPSNVTSIGSNAFINCTGLIGITFPASVRSIGSSAFGNCIGLTNVTIPSTVTSVGLNAFIGCNDLSITWNYNPVLSAYGFKDYLTYVVFPINLTSISNNAFEDCTKLSSIIIPNSVTSIGYQAFKGCTNLSEIILPSDLTYIADSTFFGCFSLTSIILPESLESIYDYAFYECYSLTTIDIPESVTYIGYGVFGECVSLTSITIPSGVNSIKPETFYYCLSLEEVVISLGVEYIEFNAFRYCTNLRTITLPESITYIGIQAFSNCTNLGLVHLKREAPDITLIDEYAFDDTNARINVPKRSFIEYKTSPDLEDYRNRIICTTLTETGLDHYSFSDYTLTRTIDVGNNDIIVIHVMDTGTYQIEASSNSAIQMAIYDEDMNLISTITYLDPSNTSGYIVNTFSSLWDMYYLVFSFTDPTVSGTIETSFMWLN